MLLYFSANEKPYFVNMSSSIFVGNLSGFTLELKVQRTTPLTLTIEGDDLIKRNSILGEYHSGVMYQKLL